MNIQHECPPEHKCVQKLAAYSFSMTPNFEKSFEIQFFPEDKKKTLRDTSQVETLLTKILGWQIISTVIFCVWDKLAMSAGCWSFREAKPYVAWNAIPRQLLSKSEGSTSFLKGCCSKHHNVSNDYAWMINTSRATSPTFARSASACAIATRSFRMSPACVPSSMWGCGALKNTWWGMWGATCVCHQVLNWMWEHGSACTACKQHMLTPQRCNIRLWAWCSQLCGRGLPPKGLVICDQNLMSYNGASHGHKSHMCRAGRFRGFKPVISSDHSRLTFLQPEGRLRINATMVSGFDVAISNVHTDRWSWWTQLGLQMHLQMAIIQRIYEIGRATGHPKWSIPKPTWFLSWSTEIRIRRMCFAGVTGK